MQIQPLTDNWQFHQEETVEWLPAKVPGSVHTDLMASGCIPDPFVADNEKRVQWVAESDWVYQTSFTCTEELLSEEKVFLVCDGLDTLATVVLNGHELGHTDNMFRQYRWDVRPLLRATDANELRITFASPVRYASEKQKARALPGVSQAIPGGPYLRKAPCQFGWDWGPQLPPVGIWKDLRLEGYTGTRLEQVHLRQAHVGGQVTVEALVTGPELLIADEPTSMLDASLRVTVLNLLVDLRKRHNMGIIFVTHDLGQAYYVSDRILVMYHGELVEQGPVEKVLANPQHDYTKRLLADVPRLHGWGAILTKPDASR